MLLPLSARGYDAFSFKWPASKIPVPYRVNPGGAPAGFTEACQAGAATWATPPSVAFSFSYEGTTATSSVAYDGVHAVYWRADGAGMSSSTLAVTWSWYSGSTYTHFDMAFNGTHSWSTSPGAGQFDIQSVALHEFGHALGLGHSGSYSAIMYPSISSGKIKRSISDDDIAGAAFQYPSTDPPPAAPTLVSPFGTVVTTTPTFTWNAVSGADSYTLQVNYNNGSKIYAISSITGTSFQPAMALMDGVSYWWWVRAHGSTGTSNWSATGTFSVALEKPERPATISPDGTLSDTTPTFTWNPTANTTYYEVQVNVDGGAKVFAESGVTETSFTRSTPLPAGSYMWWVRAWNSQTASDWSETRRFTISLDKPGVPVVHGPTGTIETPTPTFDWEPSANATHYEFQVNRDDGVSKIILLTNLAETSYTPTSPLASGYGYTWYVRAWNQSMVSQWAGPVAFRVELPTPGTPVLIEPSGELTDSTPTFRWEPVAGATHYVFQVNVADGPRVLQVGGLEGTSYTLPTALESGKYWWWVRAYTGSTAGDWSKTGAFSLAVPTPGVSTLIEPSGTIADARPTFRWNGVEGATHYLMQVNVANGNKVFQTELLTGTSYTHDSGLPTGDYWWWVRAYTDGAPGPWSVTGTFRVEVPKPGTPVLIEPAGTIAVAAPTFRWQAVTGATHYTLQINVAGGGMLFVQSLLTGLEFTPSFALPNSGDYWWWVRAHADGTAGDWSATGEFSVRIPKPAPPTLQDPSGSISDATPTFRWSSVSGASHYELQINIANGSQLFATGKITGTSYTLGNGLSPGSYWWWVRSWKDATVGDWSSTGTFSIVIPTPGIPELLGPTGTITTRTPTFQWKASSSATHYQMQINVAGGSPVFQTGKLTGTEYTHGSELPDGSYTWWVRAWNQSVVSNWSATGNLTITPPEKPGNTVISAPGPMVPQAELSFSWTAASKATHYHLLVAVAGGAKVYEQTSLDGTSHTPANPFEPGDYRVWVRAFNGSTAGDWSAAVDFSVKIYSSGIAMPTLLAPAGRLHVLPASFGWTAVSNATEYELLVKEIASGSVAYTKLGITGTSHSAPEGSLALEKQYRWWVRAHVGSSYGPWSGSKEFLYSKVGLDHTVENGADGWSASGLWHHVETGTSAYPEVHGGTRSWWYGLEASGTYDNGAGNSGSLSSPSFSVPESAELTFWSWERTEGTTTTWDQRVVEISSDGGASWTVLYRSTDNSATWRKVSLALGGYAGKTVHVRFRFATVDEMFNMYRGWYVDDVMVASTLAMAKGAFAPTGATEATRPEFSWPPVTEATGYELVVLDAADEKEEVLRVEVPWGTRYRPDSPFLPGKSYDWWIRGYRKTESGTIYSEWSPRQQFSVTGSGLPAPVIRAPEGRVERDANDAVKLQWSSVKGAHHYEIRCHEVGGQLNVLKQNDLTTSEHLASGLKSGVQYTLWVRAWTESGVASPWSEGSTFTVQ